MELWQDLEARYAGQLPTLSEREAEHRQRQSLRDEYLGWCRGAVMLALDAVGRALEQRIQQYPWLSTIPLTVSQAVPLQVRGEVVSSMTARLWRTSVDVYARCGADGPPSLHLLRQWGGHRSPRMVCLPGAWLSRDASGGYALHHFDESGSSLDADDLAATIVSLLLGRAGHH
jgi:hypothetical protein